MVAMDRRRYQRAVTGGSVIVHSGGGAQGRIVDVSKGGIRIQPADGAPRCEVGDRVWMDLHFDRQGASWIRLGVEVVRVDPAGAMAVAIQIIPLGFASSVQEVLATAVEAAASSQVLLVDGSPERRAMLATALRDAGCYVHEASTPLEAITVLGRDDTRDWLVAVADSEPLSIADELRTHVADAHPLVRVVSLGVAAN
jgi:hypothetical protein